jgi:hypothetical protein
VSGGVSIAGLAIAQQFIERRDGFNGDIHINGTRLAPVGPARG